VPPGPTARLAIVPSAGADTVATALAVTEAGTSTTSVTVARRTSTVGTPSVDDEHAGANNARASTSTTSARGARRTRRAYSPPPIPPPPPPPRDHELRVMIGAKWRP